MTRDVGSRSTIGERACDQWIARSVTVATRLVRGGKRPTHASLHQDPRSGRRCAKQPMGVARTDRGTAAAFRDACRQRGPLRPARGIERDCRSTMTCDAESATPTGQPRDRRTLRGRSRWRRCAFDRERRRTRRDARVPSPLIDPGEIATVRPQGTPRARPKIGFDSPSATLPSCRSTDPPNSRCPHAPAD
jgi:hypothetical protein